MLPVDFHRVIVPFLHNIVPAYFMTHIVSAVKSGNIGNILLLKGLINLAFFPSRFRPPVILDVVATTYHKGQMISLTSKPQKKYDVGIHKRT